MKLIFLLSILFLFNSCSFDDKSGIWKNETITVNERDKNIFKDFKRISAEIESLKENKIIDKNFQFKIEKPYLNKNWEDIFYGKGNNFKNFKYEDSDSIIFKSKKLSKKNINSYTLFSKGNYILNDKRGNIIIYSLKKNSIISKFNFYKNKFKHLDKTLNLAVEENIIYVSDNIGFIYAYDYKKNKTVWAKNYKVPFLSNIKILTNELVASNQNNDLYILNKLNGNLLKKIPTENTKIKNLFKNNLSVDRESIFYLNTYGSLYSIDQKKFNINWFINLNLSNLFSGSNIVNYDDKLLLSANQFFYTINSKSGSVIYKKNFSSNIKPLVINNYVFLVTKDNFLISMNLTNGEIIYSYNLDKKISEFGKTNSKKIEVKNIFIADNKLFIFLKNSHVIKLNLKGEIIEIFKLINKIKSNPIFVNNNMLYLDKKKKLIILN